jgi:heme exporter protein C
VEKMQKNWWKISTVLLLLFTVVYSLMTWLQPGIALVSNEELKSTDNKVIITGYNTDFTLSNESFEKPIVFLYKQNSDEGFCVSDVKVIDKTHLEVIFNLPPNYSGLLDMTVYYSEDALILPSAFRVVENNQEGEKSNCLPQEEKSFSPSHPNAFPNQPILQETIRNLMFHVPMWFAMMLLFIISIVYSIKYLRSNNEKHDRVAYMAIYVGLLFGVLGILTGSLWARFTWGQWWVYEDPKLNGSALTVIIYLAYIILRNSVNEEQKRARLAAVYNVFAFAMMIVFIWVVPRMVDSLHPGNGGNPAFSNYDLDANLRMVFYPAVLGWMGISIWILTLRLRIQKIKEHLEN